MANMFEVIELDKFRKWLRQAFSDAGITSVTFLNDDAKVERAASYAYQRLPLVPARAFVKTTIGKDGFTKLIFRLREKLLEANTLDLAHLDSDTLERNVSQVQKSTKD